MSGAASENYSSTDLTTDYNGIFNPRGQNSSGDFSLTSRDVMHITNKKNDQEKQNQKQMKNPIRNDVPFSAPRQKNTDEEKKPTMDMLDEDEQSVQWTMQRVRSTVKNTLDLTNMIGGYY